MGEELVSFSAPEDCTNPRPGIRRKPCARHWIAQSKCAQNRANGAVMCHSLDRKDRYARIFKDIETAFPGVDYKSFHSDAEIAMKEIFDVSTATPGVIIPDIAIIFAQNGASLGRALNDID